MVMETPTPQCVGLEFVRQYYTVMNKAPMHLHRFYSHNSLFMHGGPNTVNDPTVGQADIHKKIVGLNFQDCHAKIRMVDAHATLGSGVVIQVTGELSNSGNPMRRFMQTFVLAPQTPKKYYVHNDIFRYQDEVFSDDDQPDESVSEPEEELEPVDTTAFTTTNSNSAPQATVNGTSHHLNHHKERDTSPVISNMPVHIIQSPPQAPPTSSPSLASVSPPSTTPATISTERPATPPTEVPVNEWNSPSSPAEDWGAEEPAEQEPVVAAVIPSPQKKETPVKATPPPEKQPTPEPAQQTRAPPSNEPKTFANLFKTSYPASQSNSNTVSQTTSHNESSTGSQQQSNSSQPAIRSESVNSRPAAPASTGSSSSTGPPSQSSNSRLSRNFYEENRRPPVPDSQQVFVGNLPHSIGEDQLRYEFTQYGKILEVRINTGKGKTGPKGPGGHQVPNFGFIAFEDEKSVSNCLNARPIYLNGENRINVEEKKARSRVDSMSGGASSGGRGDGRPQSGRGGGMGGSGGMRGAGPQDRPRGSGRGGVFSRDNSRGGSGGSRGGGFMQRR